ncbi:MAG: adenylate kinase [Tissierellia bacterium]|nr:adenylate kinase [Tissierellia bacterium]
MRLILLGPPGAGKGTQAANLIDSLNIPHISTGDIFRANIKNETELGKEVKSYLNEGKLVPDELTTRVVWDRLDQEDCKCGFLLDGFPRTIPQAEALKAGLIERGLELDKVVNIDVDTDILVKRLAGRRVCKSCGATYHVAGNPPKVDGKCDSCDSEVIQRDDDKEETVLNRIKVYENQTQPLINYYTKEGLILTFDGTKPIDELSQEILDALNESK